MGNSLHDLHGDHVQVALFPAQGATADGSAVVFVAPFDCEVQSVKLVPEATVTGNDTNYSTLTLYDRGTDGSGSTSLKAHAFKSGTNLTAVTENAHYATAVDADEGEVYEIVQTHANAGLAIPNTVVITRFRGR